MITGRLLLLLLLTFTLNVGVVEGARGGSRSAVHRRVRVLSKSPASERRHLLLHQDDDDDDDPSPPGGKAKKVTPPPTPPGPKTTTTPPGAEGTTPPLSPTTPSSGSTNSDTGDNILDPSATNNAVPTPAPPPETPKPVFVVQWGSNGWATEAPTPDMTLERICQAAWNGEPYKSNNHVLVNYKYQVVAKKSLTASSVPDAVGRILTEGYILRYCEAPQRRTLWTNAGDVQSIASYQATLLLDHNCTTDCDSTTQWQGTNRVYFRDDYDITKETEGRILQDIIYAFDNGDVLDELKKDTTVEDIEFVTGSGATAAVVVDLPPPTQPETAPNSISSIGGIESKSKGGMKPVGIAFLSIACLSVAAVALVGGFVSLKKKRQQTQSRQFKNMSQVHLGTANTLEDDDDFNTMDISHGFIKFKPGKVRVNEPHDTASLGGYGAEMMFDDQSSIQSSYTNPLRRNISVDEPHATRSLAGYGAEMKLRDSMASRFTPDTLPRDREVTPSVHHLRSDESSRISPRNYRVPDTLDL